AIGSSLTITNFGPNPPAGKRIIHSTNDHEDVNKDHRVECAMIGDAKISLDQLLDALSGADIRNKGDVAASVGKVRSEWRADWQRHLASNEVPIDPYRVVNDLMETVDRENVIITHDSGSPREQLHPFWESVVPNSYMGWGKSTQLGHSLGLALGAKLARPDKLCVHVLGDAAIGMVGMDLETAARNGIAILTVVLNNGIMAAEREVLIESDKKYAAMTVGGNYKPVAEALGVAGFRVDAPGNIVPVLREAIAVTESGRPALVECMTAECQEFSRY
ncbi:MAG: thiamine pyrophosphate-dependent enzyme, partial [Alphaproteobacteria bacterium]